MPVGVPGLGVIEMKQFESAISYAVSHEIDWTRDPLREPLRYGVHQTDPPPWNTLRGPVHPRGGVSGVIFKSGHCLAQWGEPERSDQTFSVAKSYLGLLTGVAIEQRLIERLDELVADSLGRINQAWVAMCGFENHHNRQITWRHLLSQTSEWSGTSFGIPDQVEHFRHVVLDPKPLLGKKGEARVLQAPGTYWEYNDVRINQLSLALLCLFGESLSSVFKSKFLEPLGCSGEFAWEGYEDAWIDLQKPNEPRTLRVQSVPGGTHWGGGIRISALDQARIAQMMLDGGRTTRAEGSKILLDPSWISAMQTPCPIAPFYGLLTWLNPGRKTFPGASESAYFMYGAGGNYVWIDPDMDSVVVVRWIDAKAYPEFTRMIESALRA
jgi:CubicO group peptidase (beta-lactamase class C family)